MSDEYVRYHDKQVPASQVDTFKGLAEGWCPSCYDKLSDQVFCGTSKFLQEYSTEADIRVLRDDMPNDGKVECVCEGCGLVWMMLHMFSGGDRWIATTTHIRWREDLQQLWITGEWDKRYLDFQEFAPWWFKFGLRRSVHPKPSARLAGAIVLMWEYWEDGDDWYLPHPGWDHWFYLAAKEIADREGVEYLPHCQHWWDEKDGVPSKAPYYLPNHRRDGGDW